ncbi:hypothetical protein C0585_00020 [Candidatus Woesearchaeota archaeon]|nr:MAG: hypothetical protein C0585_00020 [Candidatus Woesearchaeota archaeon]
MEKVISGIIYNTNSKIDEILFVKKFKGDFWILPGGKKEEGESNLETLSRELNEEIDVNLKNARKIGKIYGKTPYSNKECEVTLYLAEISGKPSPKKEISEAQYFNDQYNVSELTRKALELLNRNYSRQ